MHARMRGNGLKLHQGRFGLDIETFLLRRSNNTLTWAAQGGDQAPRTTQGSGWDGLTVDLNDLRGLFYPQWSHNSVCHAARPQKLQVCVSHQNLFAKLSCLLNQSCLALQRSPQPLQTGDRRTKAAKPSTCGRHLDFYTHQHPLVNYFVEHACKYSRLSKGSPYTGSKITVQWNIAHGQHAIP